MNRRNNLRLLAIIISGVSTLNVAANGFRLASMDAFATARGEAFVATADNPSAIYYNPAGITQLQGNNFRGGIYGIYLRPTFTPPTNAPNSTNTYYDKKNLAAVPQFFYTYTPDKSPVSFGLGVYSPYGMSVEWPQDTGFRTVGIEGSMTYITINPVVGVKLAPNLSLGAGVTFNYASTDMSKGLIASTQTNRANIQRFTGDGWGISYNVGLLWQANEKVSLGFCFRGETDITMKGHSTIEAMPFVPKTNLTAQTMFPFPMQAVVGLSYRPTPKWNLEFDADYSDWSGFKTITIKQSGSDLSYGQDFHWTMNWEPSWLFEFGATRYLGEHWQVSAGYVYSQNSMPDAHYLPVVADMNRQFLCIGTGYKGKTINVDVAYQFGYAATRVVKGSEVSFPSGQTADGSYNFISHAVMLTAGVHF